MRTEREIPDAVIFPLMSKDTLMVMPRFIECLVRERVPMPPPFDAMLATDLPHLLNPDEVARVFAILGAHMCSTIGVLPETPRTVVHGILREAKLRKRKSATPTCTRRSECSSAM
jgi:hypothetical protein